MQFSQSIEIIKQTDGSINIAMDSDTMNHFAVTFMELRYQYEPMLKWMQDKSISDAMKEPYVGMFNNYGKSLSLLTEILKSAGMSSQEIKELKIPFEEGK